MRILFILLILISSQFGAERNEKYYAERYSLLINSALSQSITSLYYSSEIKSAAHNALESVDDSVIDLAIIEKYKMVNQERDKWNLLVIMIGRINTYHVSTEVDWVIRRCISNLSSKDDWLRTESVYGLGLNGNMDNLNDLKSVDGDVCESVIFELNRAKANIIAKKRGQLQ